MQSNLGRLRRQLADGAWLAVATSAELPTGTARRFEAPGVIGFVSTDAHGVTAVSGACTHLDCLLRQNTSAERLDCPCHRTAFGYDGRLLFSELATPPAPLPRLRTREQDGRVEVFVPRTL